MLNTVTIFLGWASFLGVTIFAWVRGYTPERLAAVFVMLGAFLAMAIHAFLPKGAVPVALLAGDGLLALSFLVMAVLYGRVWLGVAMMLLAVQFSLHAYYFVAGLPHDRIYPVINNLVTLGVLGAILFGAATARRRAALPVD